MITPTITAKGNGWFEFAINDSDEHGSVEFSMSFQTRQQAEAFAASLGFAMFGADSTGLPTGEFAPRIDREIAQMMRENRSVSL